MADEIDFENPIPDWIPDSVLTEFLPDAEKTVRRSRRRRRWAPVTGLLGSSQVWWAAFLVFCGLALAASVVGGLVYAVVVWPWAWAVLRGPGGAVVHGVYCDRGSDQGAVAGVEHVVKSDAALELVEAYLGVNDYFLLTDLELHEWTQDSYRTITDVDVVAVRLPSPRGAAHYHDGDGAVECLLAGEVDPALGVATDRCDVIIGEVKRGEASFNPALREHRVLHAVLRRVGLVTQAPPDQVVDELSLVGWAASPWAQLRLVAFGSHGSVSNGMVIRHDHMVDWLNGMLERHRDLFEITGFSDPVLSLLAFTARINRSLAAPSNDSTAVPT